MRLLCFFSLTVLLLMTGCGPSQETRTDANNVYSATIETINLVNNHDSEYVFCMQYLMREIQSPDLKKNKNKTKIIRDSIGLLDARLDTLRAAISSAVKTIEKLRDEKPDFSIFKSADTLLSRYDKIAGEIYPEINTCVKKVSLPVKDSEYTRLLQLSYEADSVLNMAMEEFNNESAAFFEDYSLKDFRKK